MTLSLRVRLILIILLPLLLIASIIGAFALLDAQERAADRFDRSLLSAALAISRDVAVSGGDALSPETNALLTDTSGGKVYYHVYAPDGVFVTGYATPPIPPGRVTLDTAGQSYFDGQYQGSRMRVLRFIAAMQIDGLTGEFTITVWQNIDLREQFVRDLAMRSFLVLAALVFAVALVVWFGVRYGLRPLFELEMSISRRSADELTPIRRAVPQEAKGLVSTLNHLLEQVTGSMKAKDEFISNAAHQLRNPIAGVVAMSEAVQSAKSFAVMKERSAELVVAAHQASDLANKLLALERAKTTGTGVGFAQFAASGFLAEIGKTLDQAAAKKGVKLVMVPPGQAQIFGNKIMLREAVINLIDNALVHGGRALTEIRVSARDMKDHMEISVVDNGKGIAPADLPRAVERFSQVEPSSGSGLGLAIAKATAEHHGGELVLGTSGRGLCAQINLPLTPLAV